ncbi:hypothetical protein M426DRAFT_320865 [Hypoxylon sp. CI-4A]|nr:hypothetical protein M426DRAFT_320865 [Hypoxylon sp. CI-4A]
MQQENPIPGYADSGMERRAGRLDHGSAPPPREAVTLMTGRGTAHPNQRQHEQQQEPEQRHFLSTSTNSHGVVAAAPAGAATTVQEEQRHDHVSSLTEAPDHSATSNPSPGPSLSAATTTGSNPAPAVGGSGVNVNVNVGVGGVVDKIIDSHAVIDKMTISPSTTTEAATATAENYEQQHVHSVYESIASHFSSTRYKPWPFVASFLASLPPGSVGLDVGCGNGKYLDVNRDIVILGSDRSANLAALARDLKVAGKDATDSTIRTSRNCGADVVGVADGLALPFGGGGSGGSTTTRRVDFAICIAVVHHLSTRERRIEGVRALLDCVQPHHGKVLVYVWALEQGSSRRGWDEGTADQDQLVPWVLKQKKKKAKEEEEADSNTKPAGTTYQRYYHLYRKGELEEDVVTAGGEVLDSGYEKDNWWAIASPKQ